MVHGESVGMGADGPPGPPPMIVGLRVGVSVDVRVGVGVLVGPPGVRGTV